MSEEDIRDLRTGLSELHTKLDARETNLYKRLEKYTDDNHVAHNCLQKQLGEMSISMATLASSDEVGDIDKKVNTNKIKVNMMFSGLGVAVMALFGWFIKYIDKLGT